MYDMYVFKLLLFVRLCQHVPLYLPAFCLTLPPSLFVCVSEHAEWSRGVNYSGCLGGWNKNPAQTA